MDVTAITQFVSTVGFPIAACVAMFWMVNKQNDSHKQEIDKMSEALNNNTIALTKLTDKLEERKQHEG